MKALKSERTASSNSLQDHIYDSHQLLQYTFEHQMIPLTIAEFWWGHSSDSPQWKHRSFYPACTHKCGPILKHMLSGMVSHM
ncbi:MAG: hypothetical protein JXQ90_03655 [Cyclobacteriaceae bacterium]